LLITTGMMWTSIVIKLCAGGAIGVGTLSLMYRFRPKLRVALIASIIAGVVFLLSCGVGGWADSHAEFVDGKRVDLASWGEDLRLRNFLAENTLLLATVSSSIAAFLVGMSVRHGQTHKT